MATLPFLGDQSHLHNYRMHSNSCLCTLIPKFIFAVFWKEGKITKMKSIK